MTNIISTTKSGSAAPATANEPPIASKLRPTLVAETAEASLESCINTRRAELIFKLSELRASMHLEAMEAGDKIKARLSELSHLVKEGIVDGWANVSDSVKQRLDRWLAESARQVTAQPTSGQS
jgi:hypothetical protein